MNPYDHLDYKHFLKANLREKKTKISSRYTYECMAKACRIQTTYLSRVLNSGKAHLSEDQLFQACNFLGLSVDERRYMEILRSYAKSDVRERKEELMVKIQSVRARENKSERHLTADTMMSTADLSDYYLDPNVMLVHIFLATPKFQADPRRICAKLDISEDYLMSVLSKLERMKLISLTDGHYVLVKENTHLSVDSPLYRPFRFMQRFKTIERVQKLPKERTYNFSVVFSATEAIRQEIRSRFLTFLKETELAVTNSSEEEVYQMNFDIFDWSL